MDWKKVDQYLDQNLDQSIQELSKLCAQPSVAAQNWGLNECAALVGDMLKQRGFSIDVLPTDGAPVVMAERKGRTDKTLLFYNHYDVQPPEPLELWESPAFEPTLRDGKLFARGVSDDKGHITSRLFAIDALLAADESGELPCNVKFIIEGEEEVSSKHLHEFILEHKDRLQADACIWEFGGVDFDESPMQILGLRGICYVELSSRTAVMDVHSGTGGSIFPNAAWRLVWALNTLKTPDERIQLPGHYDSVIPPTQQDWDLVGQLPDVADEYKNRYGISGFVGGVEGGAALRVNETFLPTCTICGLSSGYEGEGSKTVLPAFAKAKVDFRLAMGQTPEQVLASLRKHLDQHGFQDIEITYLGGERPGRTDPAHPFVKTVIRAAEGIYEKPMRIVPMIGGSGPVYPFIADLGLPVATSGIGYPGTQAHAPNENIRIDQYLKGAKHIARIITYFAEDAQ